MKIRVYNKNQNEIEQMFDEKINTPLTEKERNRDMERTYVFNFVFKVMAAAGIFAILGLAGASDLNTIANGELFLYGGLAFLAAAVGIWGASNCSRSIAAFERRQRREKARLRVVMGSKAA